MAYPENGSTNMKSQAAQCQKSKSRARNWLCLVPLSVTRAEPQQRHATEAPPGPAGSVVIHHPKHDPCEQHRGNRSEEHTSELQSLRHLVCRLLLEKKKNNTNTRDTT